MKKLFFTFALSAICGLATAQTFSVPDVEVKPGEKASFTLIVNTGDFKARGFEYHNLELPAGVTLTKKTTTTNSSFTITISDDQRDAFCGALTAVEFPQNEDYEVGTIELEAASTLEVGTELEVAFPKNSFMFYNSEGSVYVTDPVTFNVKVVDVYTVVLDENSEVVPEAAEGVNVTVKRTINANEWSTICLPFDMTEAQVNSAFGDKVEIANFVDYDAEYADDKETIVTNVVVNFQSVTAMEANHPYIIKVGTPISYENGFMVKGVNIAPEDDPCVEYDNGLTGKKRVVYGGFYGTYVANTAMPYTADDRSVFLSGGKFWYATSASQTMKAYRGYFWFSDELSLNDEVRIALSLDEQTGINNITTLSDGEYYDLRGQRVETPSKGIYIKNGKKIVVK